MKKIKIILILFCILFFILAIFYGFWSLVFFPDGCEITGEEAPATGERAGPEELDIPLLNRLNEASFRGDFSLERIDEIAGGIRKAGYLLKPEPYTKNIRRYLCFRAGAGFPGIYIDERSSVIIPSGCALSFFVRLDGLPSIEFSALSFLSGGEIEIEICSAYGKRLTEKYAVKRYEQQYKSADSDIAICNRDYEKAAAPTGWHDYKIELPDFDRHPVQISFSFNGGDGALFLANPRIFGHAEKRRLNVIMVFFDGVASEYLGVYNEKSKLTPFMKEKAQKEFIVFDNMISSGNTKETAVAGLFTSAPPFFTKAVSAGDKMPEKEGEKFYRDIRECSLASLPDVFSKRRYVTAQFTGSGESVRLLTGGTDFGFSRLYGFFCQPHNACGINHKFFKFLRKNKEREFFIYLHYNSTGRPLYAPANNYIKGIVNSPLKGLSRPLLAGAVNYTDSVFRNIYAALEKNNLLGNTILIVATDHGSGYGFFKPYSGLQYNDYTRMAFMLRLPETLKSELGTGSGRIREFFSALAIAPTVVDLCGMNTVSAFQGRSFKPLLKGEGMGDDYDDKIWCFGKAGSSLILDGRYKYILNNGEEKGRAGEALCREEIYDLADDPSEKNNLAHQDASLLKRFRDIYRVNGIGQACE